MYDSSCKPTGGGISRGATRSTEFDRVAYSFVVETRLATAFWSAVTSASIQDW